MDYLKNIGFTSEEIENLVENVPTKVLDLLKENYKLVTQNLNFIKDLGISNYKEIFNKYYDMFLMDNSNFVEIFNKYDTKDLVDKLEKSIEIFDFL